jgi:type II secretory pathway component GspD/PulD (secretin)
MTKFAVMLAAIAAMICCIEQSSDAQVVIQLPTVNTFNVRTTVMVPDGGQMLLGGVNRGSYGGISEGLPGFSNIPGANRLFRNRGIGKQIGSSTASVTARVISLQETEAQVMAEANRMAEVEIRKNANLDPKVVRKAEFMSRNIGKRKR